MGDIYFRLWNEKEARAGVKVILGTVVLFHGLFSSHRIGLSLVLFTRLFLCFFLLGFIPRATSWNDVRFQAGFAS